MDKFAGTLSPPKKPLNIPKTSQWLSGQGGGVWFHISSTKKRNEFLIKRFTPVGEMDCNRIFEIENNGSIFDITLPYKFTHVSHCAKCRIIQNKIIYTFNYLAH